MRKSDKKRKKRKNPGKGATFERKIAKDIVKAFKRFGVKQEDCWRSVLSGGHSMSSGDMRMSKRMKKLFPYVVECKHYKKIKWQNFLLRSPKAKEIKWLDQAVEGVKKENLSPLLVMKSNDYKAVMVLYSVGSESTISPRFVDRKGRWWVMRKWTKFLKLQVESA